MKTGLMTIRRLFNKYFFFHFEWIVLLFGLLLMVFLDPMSQAQSICPVKRLNFEFCPGCGLGRSIAYLFKGELLTSIQTHPAGILAVLFIPARIVSIFHRNHKIKNTNKNEENI